MRTNKEETVRNVTKQIVQRLDYENKTGRKDAALLAALRNSAGKPIEESGDVLPFLIESLPLEFLSANGIPTFQERAVYTALQLYAICVQGSSNSVTVDEEAKKSIGGSLRNGRTDDQKKALDRRFNAMITSSGYDELAYHLRQLVRLVKSKAEMTVSFSLLANDLYWYQMGRVDQVVFRWATDYYQSFSEEKKKEGTEK